MLLYLQVQALFFSMRAKQRNGKLELKKHELRDVKILKIYKN